MSNPKTCMPLNSSSCSSQETFLYSQNSDKKIVTVNASDSICSKICRQEKDSVRNTGFHNLENEILLLVFSYFSVKELLTIISKVCRHWHHVVWSPRLWKSLEFRDETPKTEIKCKLLRKAPLLESLTLYKAKDTVTIIRQVCRCNKNLIKLKIRHCQDEVNKVIPEIVLRNILHSCYNLETLDLKNTQFTSTRFYQALSNLPHLKKLNLSNNEYIRPQDLISIALNCRFLEDISITRPKTKEIRFKITNEDVVFFFNNLSKTLKRIKFDFRGFEDSAVQAMLKCNNLEKLDLRDALLLTGNVLREYAYKLKSLKILHLTQAFYLKTEDFIFLGKQNVLKNLTSLSLSGCWQLSESALHSILKCTKNLSHLNLKACKLMSGFNLISKNCPYLKYLNISYAFKLEDECSLENLIDLKKLRTLVIGINVNEDNLILIHENLPEITLMRSMSEYYKDEHTFKL